MTKPRQRPRAPSQAGLYPRGNIIWMRYQDAAGKWKCASSGLVRGREAEAAQLLGEIKRQVAAGREVGVQLGSGPLTFASFFAWWIERREARGLRTWADDSSRIRTHVLKLLGGKVLDAITAMDLERVVVQMRKAGKAPKTCWNTYSSVRALFRDAIKNGVLVNSPCVLGQEELGPMVDKDPEWREGALYERSEVESLMFDARIPWDRRMYYAIEYFAGRRLGEVSGLRVRHLDLQRQPLASVLFARSYDAGRTKTNTSVLMPIHPLLDGLLRRWISEGFPAMFGRPAGAEDFVVPRPPDAKSKFGPCRDKNYVRKQLIKDLEVLDLRHRRSHDLRRSFITHAQQDGAAPQILMRLTHPSTKKATAFAGYTEFAWEDYCREVVKLHVDVPEELDAVALPVAVGDDDRDPDDDPPPTPGGVRMARPGPTKPASRPRLATPVATQKEKPQGSPGVLQWTRQQHIRTLATIPLEIALVEFAPIPAYQRIAASALELHDLGWTKHKIALHFGVDSKTAAKALAFACRQAGLPKRRGGPINSARYKRVAKRAVELKGLGWNDEAIAKEVGVTSNTVRRALAWAAANSPNGGES